MYKTAASKMAILLAAGLATTMSGGPSFAQSDETRNTVKAGYAVTLFNTDSGELTGPPGTTPPGATAELKDTSTLGLVYERKLAGPWAIVLQGGLPPIVKFDGAGTAAQLGHVGSARAWFPALLVGYSFLGMRGFEPYVGAGLNYTFFTDESVTGAYNRTFRGTSSDAKLKDSVGPALKLGVNIPIVGRWSLDLSYTHYWIKTTATIQTDTPGGVVERRIDVKANPDIFALLVGYRF